MRRFALALVAGGLASAFAATSLHSGLAFDALSAQRAPGLLAGLLRGSPGADLPGLVARTAPVVAGLSCALAGWRLARQPAGVAAAMLCVGAALPLASHGALGALLVGPALLTLEAFEVSAVLGAALSLGLALLDPAAGASVALAGALVARSHGPVFAALAIAGAVPALLPAAAPVGGLDATPLAGLWPGPRVDAPLLAALLAPLVAAVVARGQARLRLVAALGWLIALGPVLQLGRHAVAGPALPLAWLGLEGGWSGAVAVSVAGAALGLARTDMRLLPAVAGGVALLEGAILAILPHAALPARTPVLVRHLGEKAGEVLVLPAPRCGGPASLRRQLWQQWALAAGRSLHAPECLPATDPVLAEPGVVVALDLDPAEGAAWLIPPYDPGAVLRANGVSEILVDRAAWTGPALARLDAVLARLYGPPQRDLAGGIDSYRVDPEVEPHTPKPPFLRTVEGSQVEGWRTVEELLEVGATRFGVPPAAPGSPEAPPPEPGR